MAGLGDITSALGGIGEAINGGVSGYIEAKKEKRVTDRQDQLWNEQQDEKAVQDVTDAGNVANFRSKDINPIYQVDQHWGGLENPAPQGAGTTQTGSSPQVPARTVKAAPAAPQGSLAQAVAQRQTQTAGAQPQAMATAQPVAQPQQEAPAVPPPGWEPSDPALKGLNTKYEKARQQADEDLAKIDAMAGNDPARKQRLYAAYYRLNKPKFDDLQQELIDYNKTRAQAYQKKRAIDGMEKWFSDEGLGNTFGQGARKEGNTLVLPDGKTGMILQTPLIWAAYKQGIATEKEVMDAWGKDTKNAEDLMSKSKETAVEIEKMREQNRLQLAQLRAQRDPKADMAQRVYALHRHMGEDDATATRAEASFIEHGDKTDLDKLKEDDMEQTRAGKRVDSVMKQFADIAGGYDEKKMTPSRTLAIYNSMIKTDKPGAAALYLRLPDPNRAAIDAQNAQDAGANRPGSGQSPTAKPSQVKSPSPKPSAPANVNIAQERQNAAAAIKQRPDIADRVKSEYKKRTGKDY
jgi:hypothetical protein